MRALVWTYLVWALNLVNSVIMAVVFSLDLQSSLHFQDVLWYKVLTQPVQWWINFVTGLALLFLFHYQGRKRRETERPAFKELMGS